MIINDHLKIFGKDSNELDYDSMGPCPLCGSRVDEFNFCACGGNLRNSLDHFYVKTEIVI